MNWKALEAVLDGLPKCEKGLCRAPATRVAKYTWKGQPSDIKCPSCDEHGGESETDFLYAEPLRQVIADMRAAGFTCWWDEGDSIRPPTPTGSTGS